MKTRGMIVVAGALLILAALACGTGTGAGTVEEPFEPGECDPSTISVDMNTEREEHVNAGTYPDTCNVYCLWVPEDGRRLEIGISGFDVDLDMYVDTDVSVLEYSDHGQWESNAYGTDDEAVSISNPGGRYYIQICSYEGLASDFVLSNTYAP